MSGATHTSLAALLLGPEGFASSQVSCRCEHNCFRLAIRPALSPSPSLAPTPLSSGPIKTIFLRT